MIRVLVGSQAEQCDEAWNKVIGILGCINRSKYQDQKKIFFYPILHWSDHTKNITSSFGSWILRSILTNWNVSREKQPRWFGVGSKRLGDIARGIGDDQRGEEKTREEETMDV